MNVFYFFVVYQRANKKQQPGYMRYFKISEEERLGSVK